MDEGNGVSVRDSNKDHPFRELDILPVRWIQQIGTILHVIYSNAILRPFSFAEVIRLIQGES